MSFLHSLCTIPPNMLSRQVFDLRMNLFTLRGYKNSYEKLVSATIPDRFIRISRNSACFLFSVMKIGMFVWILTPSFVFFALQSSWP